MTTTAASFTWADFWPIQYLHAAQTKTRQRRISSSESGEKCSPIDEGDDLFGVSQDDEVFIKAASQYERGLKGKALPPTRLAAVVAEAAAAATKASADGLRGTAPTSDVLPQEG
jgi:hypothetical protein